MNSSHADPSPGAWVFAYGSLVDRSDLASYVGRAPREGTDWHRASLDGYERNWVVGMRNLHDDPDDKFFVSPDDVRFDGVVLALGVACSDTEQVNGVVFRVEPQTLALLDARERRYNRTDVTDSVVVGSASLEDTVVYTYIPRADAVDTAAAAIREGTAAVPRAYHDKVRAAFTLLGERDLPMFDTSTRIPDAPVVDLTVVRPGTDRHVRG